MRPIVSLDTETTGLHPERRAWEIGLITRQPGQPDTEHRWFVASEDLDLDRADPKALEIGHFYQRHPQLCGPGELVVREESALRLVADLTRDAIVVGSKPTFDMDTLAPRMAVYGIKPTWYHHPDDVAAMAKGWLRGRGLPLPEPQKSDVLSRAVGVEPPRPDERHSALADARWCLRLWDAIMGAEL